MPIPDAWVRQTVGFLNYRKLVSWACRLICRRRVWTKRTWNKGQQVVKNVCCRLRGHLTVEESGAWIQFYSELNYMKATEANEFVPETKKEPVWSIWESHSYLPCFTWFKVATSNIYLYFWTELFFRQVFLSFFWYQKVSPEISRLFILHWKRKKKNS